MPRKKRPALKKHLPLKKPPLSAKSAALATDSIGKEAGAQKGALPFPVVGIGASAGGLEAVSLMLRALPMNTGMAFVLVQHLYPTHSSMLTEILSRATVLPVSEVRNQTSIEPDHIYVIPPGRNMVISRGVLQLSPRTETRGQHRPIDLFLRSLAEDQKHRAIGVVLSGSATDGTLGLEEIKAEGGITFAQDSTAQHKSMPQSAIAAGCIDFVLSPEEIATEIARIGRHPYVRPTKEARESTLQPGFGRVLDLLRSATGVDFSHYKRSILSRRIARRMVVHKVTELKDYLPVLQSNPAEIEALYQDILINVTSFFRDPRSFEILKTKVFPKLIQEGAHRDAVRIWVPGCSTGEEAYSIAMAFAEFAEASKRSMPVQIFGTDLNGAGIEKARAGVYSKSIVQDVSPERLRRFFHEVNGSYSIGKQIRDVCIFARHNVLTDPPFSHLDLISCRNLLIYLEPVLQQRVAPILHYALNPSGVLWLGTSETIGSYHNLFELEDAKHKFYTRKSAPVRLPRGISLTDYAEGRQDVEPKEAPREGVLADITNAQKQADRVLLAKYAPAAVLINSEMEILQFRGDTSPYLAPAPGKASLNLLKMLREGLLVEVLAAIQTAKKEERSAREENLRFKANGGFRDIHVEVIPVKGNSSKQNCFLVLFEETSAAARKSRAGKSPAASGKDKQKAADQNVARLKQELTSTREYLQSLIEQQEAANEELQSANEEAQSTNEELQSINEELETSKEEIQSTNEELNTLNDELQNRNQELSQSNNDLINLLSSIQLSIVMLGPDLRIRRFTPMAEKTLNLIASDVGRPITDIHLNLPAPDLEKWLVEVIDTGSIMEKEVRNKEGRSYLLRIQPYKTTDNKIDGAVLVVVNVETFKGSQEVLYR